MRVYKDDVMGNFGDEYGSNYDYYQNSCATATSVLLQKLYGKDFELSGIWTTKGVALTPQSNINDAIRYSKKE